MRTSVTGAGQAAKPKFLDQVRTILRTRHYSLRTEEAYVGWIRRFILYHGKRHPREMGGAEVATSRFSYATQIELAFLLNNLLVIPGYEFCS